jgi:hypothetical protein
MRLRTKNPNPSHCAGVEPPPYGKFVINAEVIPVPIITACQAQVKWLYGRVGAVISELHEAPKECERTVSVLPKVSVGLKGSHASLNEMKGEGGLLVELSGNGES